jgi:hypothetical protein
MKTEARLARLRHDKSMPGTRKRHFRWSGKAI